jgi:hypothetical protein
MEQDWVTQALMGLIVVSGVRTTSYRLLEDSSWDTWWEDLVLLFEESMS